MRSDPSLIIPELLTTAAAARLCHVGERTLWQWSRSGIAPKSRSRSMVARGIDATTCWSRSPAVVRGAAAATVRPAGETRRRTSLYANDAGARDRVAQFLPSKPRGASGRMDAACRGELYWPCGGRIVCGRGSRMDRPGVATVQKRTVVDQLEAGKRSRGRLEPTRRPPTPPSAARRCGRLPGSRSRC